jgi:hypothetical protein
MVVKMDPSFSVLGNSKDVFDYLTKKVAGLRGARKI